MYQRRGDIHPDIEAISHEHARADKKASLFRTGLKGGINLGLLNLELQRKLNRRSCSRVALSFLSID